MIAIRELLRSVPVQDAMIFGNDDQPVYARLPDGLLHQIDAVGAEQILTSAGLHDVIVLAVSETTAKEEVPS